MKKLVVVTLIFSAIALSACSTYTCPTYSKVSPKQQQTEVKEVRF